MGNGDAVEPAYEAGLHADGVTFNADDATVLRAVDRTGSMNAAAEQLGRSYPHVHDRLGELDAAFGPLVEAERGGPAGGGTTLTGRARALLRRFERLQSEFSGVTEVGETVYDGCVVGRDGEITTVWTHAGELSALAPPDAANVQVTIRADTVTLYDPASAPSAGDASARNQLRGTVADLDERESVVGVEIDIPNAHPLTALVTSTSASELSLAPGREVVASFKTTATRAIPRE